MIFEILFVLFHCAAAAAVLLAGFIPALSEFLAYGKTTPSRSSLLASITVPKRWFSHFYVELATLTLIAAWYNSDFGLKRVALLCHAFRRLYEQLYVFDPQSKARMHLVHYFVGLCFYLFQALPGGQFTSFGLAIFITASLAQHLMHRELARTQKYKLPILFQHHSVSDPHYAAEIAIYLALPYPNAMLHCATIFWVVTNLGMSAKQQKEYYNSHGYSIRWCLTPYIF